MLFRRLKKNRHDPEALRLALRAPSAIAPGLTRTDLTNLLRSFESLAREEPPVEPEGKVPVAANVVWQFWWQGEAAAPDAVRVCLESVRRFVAPRPVILISRENYADYVDLPDALQRAFDAGEITVVELSDYLRLALLARYGGTWIDPTVYMTGPAPAETLDAPFFVHASPFWMSTPPDRLSTELLGSLRFFCDHPSATLFGSAWWMTARRGCATVRVAKRLWGEFLLRQNRARDYLMVYNLISLALIANAACRREWDEMPKRCVTPSQCLLGLLYEPYDEATWRAVLSLTNVHKLTHKIAREAIAPRMFYERIFRSGKFDA